MLLSIVECDDYKLWRSGVSQKSKTIVISKDIEVIGPILGSNVAEMRNKGASLAQGDWVFFKDKDCDIDPNQVLETLKCSISVDKNIAAIGGIYTNSSRAIIERCYHLIQKKWVHSGLIKKIQKNIFLANHLLGGAYLIKRNVLNQLKGFNENIGWGAEESDLTNRVQKMGYKTIVNYNLKVSHKNKLKLRGFLKRAWKQNFNKGKFKIHFKNNETRGIYLKTNRTYYLPMIVYLSTGLIALKSGQVIGRVNQIKRYFSWSY